MIENLEILEVVTFQIKTLLKEPMPESFEIKKKNIIDKLKKDQTNFKNKRKEEWEDFVGFRLKSLISLFWREIFL